MANSWLYKFTVTYTLKQYEISWSIFCQLWFKIAIEITKVETIFTGAHGHFVDLEPKPQ
jgi:hypothetical protein